MIVIIRKEECINRMSFANKNMRLVILIYITQIYDTETALS